VTQNTLYVLLCSRICGEGTPEDLLHEVILTIGYFTVLNNDNQVNQRGRRGEGRGGKGIVLEREGVKSISEDAVEDGKILS
jgi:hypothetical protein